MATLHDINVNDVCFQQSGTTYHTTHATFDLLRQTFDGRLISRTDNVIWLTLDHILWDTIKEKFYGDKPEAIQYLKVYIRRGLVGSVFSC